MPRAKRVQDSPAKTLQNNLIWQQTGQVAGNSLLDWDPKAQDLAELLLEVMSTGYSVTLRPGSGGKSIGVQIWTWEDKQPYIWFSEYEELDLWVSDMRERFRKHAAEKPS